ncbi:MAG: dUTP diphosphatase [Nanoarchaeota archaeon]|nr:dUTP diphosphatase [Nanoarchaeota archaeon]
MVEVKVLKMHADMTTPSYAHPGDAGIDLRSAIECVISPGETKLVPTGVKVAIPQGFVGLVWDKSGYAAKSSIHCLAGVIDAGYRGEIQIVVKNLGKDNFEVKRDMKISQLLIQPVVSAMLKEVADLDDTSRGEGGFGSTGRH